MSRYINRVLGPDEKVIYAAQIHWYVYIRGLTMLVLGALIGSLGPYLVGFLIGMNGLNHSLMFVRGLALFVITMATYLLLGAYIRQISTELVITNRRVIAKYGFIATTTFELMLTRVEGANIDQTILGRLLGFGTILVKGTGGGISPIDHIAAPYVFHNYLMKALERIQGRDAGAGKID